MSRKGNCWDNAPMESASGAFKVECVNGERFKTRDQALFEDFQSRTHAGLHDETCRNVMLSPKI
jgi:transposase InsO family protein